MSYKHYSITKELEHHEKSIAAIYAVLKKYPDADKMFFNYPNMNILETGEFCSPSIIHDKVKLEMSTGVWYNFIVIPYVDVPYEYGKISVFNEPHSFDVFKLNHDGKKATASWNNIDQNMLKAGYDPKLLKLVYDQVLLLLSKGSISNVTMIRDNVPTYILDYLPFT